MKNGEESGLLSMLSSVLKKSSEIPEDIRSLPKSFEIMAEELSKLSQAVLKITKLVMQHHEVIEEILAAQTIILSNMMKNSADSALVSTNKNKTEKPN